MATTTFTTWAALRDSLLDRLASRDFSKASYNVAGQEVSFASSDEFLKLLHHARTMAGLEDGSVSLRTYASNGGRG